MARGSPGARGSERSARADAAPLTVAAVARTLGVAASTLRTWDRRYGLGPSAHQAGSHRRYTPDDVARLQTMRRLTLRGVAPADAARIATESETRDEAGNGEVQRSADAEEPDDESLALDPLTLAAAAVEPDPDRVHRMLARSVREAGIVEAWAELVRPALEMVSHGRQQVAERPGSDPQGILQSAVMHVVRELAGQAPARVRVLAAESERLRAHVIAAGLAEQHVGALVVRAEHVPADEPLTSWLPVDGVRVLVVLGAPPNAERFITQSSERGDVEIFLLGEESPPLWLPRVHRVRTPQAAVAEISAAARE